MKKLLITTILFSTVFTNAAYAQEDREKRFSDNQRNERVYDETEHGSREKWRNTEGKHSRMTREERHALRETIREQAKNIYEERDRIQRERRKEKDR